MTLVALKQSDGVLTVTYKSSDGRIADVADFYVKPLMDGLGMNRAAAAEWQEQFAGLLLRSYERHFTAPIQEIGLPAKWECPIGSKDCRQNCGSYGCGN